MTPRYPEITVELVGQDGNAFNLLGLMQRALKQHDIPKDQIDAFMQEAMSGDYNNLLQTCMQWVDVR